MAIAITVNARPPRRCGELATESRYRPTATAPIICADQYAALFNPCVRALKSVELYAVNW